MPAASGRQLPSGITMNSLRQPSACPGHPRNFSARHVLGRPPRHWSHAPHGIAGSMATWSPGLTCVTAGPTASTTPAPSWPTANGYFTTWLPMRPSV